MNRSIRNLGLLLVVLAPVVPALASAQTTREQALTKGRSFANHRWSATAANINPSSCPANFDWYPTITQGGQSYYAGVTPYQDVIVHYVGDFVGLPYNWGGYMSLNSFDKYVASGRGAGAAASSNLESPDCTMGVDCSGFVSQAWSANGYFTTSAIPDIASEITLGAMRPGDVWNRASYHVGMFTQTLANGIPETVESLNTNVNINRNGGYAGVSKFIPRKYNQITGEGTFPAAGTLETPHVIAPNSTSQGTTAGWPSSVYSSYNCDAAGQPQAGPEVFYEVTFDQAGTFTASVADDANTDVDVHILTQRNSVSCIARDNTVASTAVGCGTYYIAVDTFGNGAANAGAFTLTTSFAPSGSCNTVAGPPAFDPKGGLGDDCSQVFCDPNQDAEACLNGSDGSFCSKACETNNDCADMTGGAGCCDAVTVTSNGQERTEHYCFIASQCEGGGSSSGGVSSSGGASGGTSGTSGSSGDDDTGAGDDDTSAADDDATAAGKKKKTTTTSGCAAAPGGTSGVGFLLAGLGLTALAARRRARRA